MTITEQQIIEQINKAQANGYHGFLHEQEIINAISIVMFKRTAFIYKTAHKEARYVGGYTSGRSFKKINCWVSGGWELKENFYGYELQTVLKIFDAMKEKDMFIISKKGMLKLR